MAERRARDVAKNLNELLSAAKKASPGKASYFLQKTSNVETMLEMWESSLGKRGEKAKKGAAFYHIKDSFGNRVGYLDIESVKDGKATIRNVLAYDVRKGKGILGTTQVRSLLKQLMKFQPEIKSISGLRVSGTRGKKFQKAPTTRAESRARKKSTTTTSKISKFLKSGLKGLNPAGDYGGRIFEQIYGPLIPPRPDLSDYET